MKIIQFVHVKGYKIVVQMIGILGSSFLMVSCVGSSKKVEVSKIKRIPFSVKSCPCDSGCYTDEIKNLSCDGKYAQFDSKGLPDPSHILLKGITNSNQQFPLEQPYDKDHNNAIRIFLHPQLDQYHVDTDSGAIGMAVNGVPLFDPSTQAAKHEETGKRPHTLDVGELDECGGHAGRGDDYHYHIAPKCLIEELGKEKIEDQKLPVGYAKDGFSIHAVGWFEPSNDIEDELDACRGAIDSNGTYFYNMKTTKKWDIINCYSGEPHETGPRGSTLRRDKEGNPISGGSGFKGMIPIKFRIDHYYTEKHHENLCHFASGEISKENLLLKSGKIVRNYQKNGTLFYCNSGCYAYFIEAEKKAPGGRITQYDLITSNCPVSLNLKQLNLFEH